MENGIKFAGPNGKQGDLVDNFSEMRVDIASVACDLILFCFVVLFRVEKGGCRSNCYCLQCCH